MNTLPTVKSDDLNDDLSDIFDLASEAVAEARATGRPLAPVLPAVPLVHEERCGKCSGSGRFVGWSGRVLGPCHACKGTGKLQFKSSSADRARRREQAAAGKARKAEQAAADFAARQPEVADWIARNAPKFAFAASMAEAVGKFGDLTEKQLDACKRGIAREAEFKAARAAAQASAPAVNPDRLFEAFETAGRNLKFPAITLAGIRITPAGAASKNAGCLYVKEGETYLGKITSEKFLRSRDCSDAQEARIVALIADPKATAIAYGKETGRCCCCNRELTDPVSIANGIGPICATNFGF